MDTLTRNQQDTRDRRAICWFREESKNQWIQEEYKWIVDLSYNIENGSSNGGAICKLIGRFQLRALAGALLIDIYRSTENSGSKAQLTEQKFWNKI